jgi:hypothetical protein
MTPYFASHLAFYMILVLTPAGEEAWQVKGGYDWCRVILKTVQDYGLTARCVSGIEWDRTGRLGRIPEPVAP